MLLGLRHAVRYRLRDALKASVAPQPFAAGEIGPRPGCRWRRSRDTRRTSHLPPRRGRSACRGLLVPALNPAAVFEVHPEVSFTVMNGDKPIPEPVVGQSEFVRSSMIFLVRSTIRARIRSSAAVCSARERAGRRGSKSPFPPIVRRLRNRSASACRAIMSRAPFILIDGKPYRWKDILELRRAQLAAAGAAQASQQALFATLHDDRQTTPCTWRHGSHHVCAKHHAA
jgi:hypothetical protein